jgi:hypothetical protein
VFKVKTVEGREKVGNRKRNSAKGREDHAEIKESSLRRTVETQTFVSNLEEQEVVILRR